MAKLQSVLIHREEYAVSWGSAPLSAGEVLASGRSWTKKSNRVAGGWEIARRGEAHVLRLGSDFKTKKAPDLKVVLSPAAIGHAANGNALSDSRVLAPLSSPKGAQEYAIPKEVDLTKYASLLIHCEQYTKLWGGVALSLE